MNNFKKNIILAVLVCQLTNSLVAVKKMTVVSDYMGSRWMGLIEFDETKVKTVFDFKEVIRKKQAIPENQEIIITNMPIRDDATINELEDMMEKRDQTQALMFDVKIREKNLKRKRSDSDEKETIEPEAKKPATESGISSRIKNWWSKK